jgi:16S rRNA (guanine527-N7)-methyltransferase
MELGSPQWQDLIVQGARSFDVPLHPQLVAQYAEYAKILVRWNEKINLTAITEPRDMAIKHFIDSLALAPFVPATASVLDMGSGAGFPGLVLKILYPPLKMTLIDGVLKKVNFIKYVIRTLKLSGAQALHTRAEALGQKDDEKNRFDFITCRAFSSMEHFALLGRPLLAEGGVLLALKGRITDQDELSPTHGKGPEAQVVTFGHHRFRISLTRYQLPFSRASRTIACLQPV